MPLRLSAAMHAAIDLNATGADVPSERFDQAGPELAQVTPTTDDHARGEAAMGFIVAAAVLVTIFVGERAAALWRRARIESRRAKADYPISDNDPVNRTIA